MPTLYLFLIAILTLVSKEAKAVSRADDQASEKPFLVETTISNQLLERLIQEQLFTDQNLVNQLKSKKIIVREKELSLSAVQLPNGAIEVGSAKDLASTITSVKVDKIWGIFGGGSGGASAKDFKLKFNIARSSIATEFDTQKSNGDTPINVLRMTISLPSFSTSQVITSYRKVGGFLGFGSSSDSDSLKLQLDDLTWTGTYQLKTSRDADDGKKKLDLKFLDSKVVLGKSTFTGSLVKGSPKTPQDALNTFKGEIHEVIEKAFSRLALDNDDSINLGESESNILDKDTNNIRTVTRTLLGLSVVRGAESTDNDARRTPAKHLKLSHRLKRTLGDEDADTCASELVYPQNPDPLKEAQAGVLNSFPLNSNSLSSAIPFSLLQNKLYLKARRGDFCKSLPLPDGGKLSFYPVGAIRLYQAKDIKDQPLNRIVFNLKLGYTYSNPLLPSLETSGELELERTLKVIAEKDPENPDIKIAYLLSLQDKVVSPQSAYSSAILDSFKNISQRTRLYPPIRRIAGQRVVFAEATVTPSHLIIRSERQAVNTVPADVRDQEILPFQCSVTGRNAGCSKKFSCPEGKRVVAVRAVCNLEYGVVSNSKVHQAVWNSLEVARASDNTSSGACSLQKSQQEPWSSYIKSGFQQLDGVLGQDDFVYSCREHDQNGGDCFINGQAICR